MPIIQVNVWTCEVCNKTLTTAEETSPYTDPVVCPPNDGHWGAEWGYLGENPDEKLACPECLAKSRPTPQPDGSCF